jgi:hypothetical protein
MSNGDGASAAPTITVANTTVNGATCTPGSSCAARTFTEAGRVRQNNSADTFYSELTSAATANRVWTLPDATDTACGIAATQTLTNKTLTTPTIASFANATQPVPSVAFALRGRIGAAIGDTVDVAMREFSRSIQNERRWRVPLHSVSLNLRQRA